MKKFFGEVMNVLNADAFDTAMDVLSIVITIGLIVVMSCAL